MSENKSEQTVIITGDVSMDWNLTCTRRARNSFLN
jgi:hypothetical protein